MSIIVGSISDFDAIWYITCDHIEKKLCVPVYLNFYSMFAKILVSTCMISHP